MKKVLLILSLFILLAPSISQAAPAESRLRGMILLQVEDYGKAWYVHPDEGTRMYMKDGDAAYGMMRDLGLGITNADLAKIPIGVEERFECLDNDNDGLCNKLEEGLGTEIDVVDSDNDGYYDGTEILNGYDPLGPDKLIYDNSLVNRLKGKILLQVEERGQAWYINPQDNKRYYMTDGPAAYEIMRYLSLGISNTDINKISIYGQVQWESYTNQEYGIAFDYPPDWPVPVVDADGEYSDGGYPQGEHSLWSMDLGEEYLDNGGPGYIYTLNAYNPKDPAQVVEDFENDSLISIVNDTVFNDTRMIFYTEGGICGFYNVFIFGDNYSIKLKSVCGADSQERTGMTEDIARTFRFIDQDVVIDCGSVVTQEDSWDNPSNYDCFIAASQDCQLAELSSTMSIIFGMAITATTNMQLKGLESDKCAYVQEVESYNVEFTDEYVQEMLDGGSTQEEIDQAEQEANDSAQDLVGVELTCKFEQDDLTAMLSRWKTGEFHGGTSCQLNFDGGEHDCEYTGDFEGAQCEYNWE